MHTYSQCDARGLLPTLQSPAYTSILASPTQLTESGVCAHTPMPPHARAHLQGLLLGMGGSTLRQLKQQSGANILVANANGHLGGAHPDPLDPSLHALITSDTLVSVSGLLNSRWTWSHLRLPHALIRFCAWMLFGGPRSPQ
jgi:hypothetical protein